MQYTLELTNKEAIEDIKLNKVKDSVGFNNEEIEYVAEAMKKGDYQKAVEVIYGLAQEHNKTIGTKVVCPQDMGNVVAKYAFEEAERMVVFTLNGAHKITAEYESTIGLVNRTMVHPREIFKYAIKENAAAIIMVHNHPSGEIEPSEDDRTVTKRITEAGELVGIPVLDHIIVGFDRKKAQLKVYSFQEDGERTININDIRNGQELLKKVAMKRQHKRDKALGRDVER